jgi:serine/threonine protein kinase
VAETNLHEPAARDERADAPTSAHEYIGPVCDGLHLGPELARGGMARVHAADSSDRHDGRDAVVKVLERSAVNTRRVHALFERSARIMAELAHPGVARVIGFERRGPRSFLAMERLRGGTLFERVKRGEPLQGPALDALLRALLEVVAHVHDRGYLHGDVTPGNVMFRRDDDTRPVLVDFDGVCAEGEGALESLVMTPGYSAPEQRVGEVGVATDLFGVGATVAFAATGKAPDRLARVGRAMELDLGDARVSPRTRAVLQRLVALDPSQRPRRAREALEALEAPAAARVRTGSRLLLAAVVVLIASTIVAAATSAMAHRAPSPPTDRGSGTVHEPARG